MRARNITAKFLAVALSLGLLITQFGTTIASAAGGTVEINIESPQSGTGYTYDSASQTVAITSGGAYEIQGTGTPTVNKIVVQSGVTANITLKNIDIDVSGTNNACAFDMTGATVNLTLSGINTLLSGKDKAGLEVPEGSTLTISASDNNQSLTATGRENGAGIGGSIGETGGNITINSGTVNATGGSSTDVYECIGGAGIGGGGTDEIVNSGDGGTITISGGVVNAEGCTMGAGIGGGGGNYYDPKGGSGGIITIRGGTVTAVSDLGGAGIGGSSGGGSGEITIYGGDITAKSPCSDHPTRGEMGSAGIGGGYWAGTGDIIIYGGKIDASAGNGAAIGSGGASGHASSTGNIVIENADITATSYAGAGIGGGSIEGNIGNISIANSKITATSTMGGAGIGGGFDGNAGDITITDCQVNATATGSQHPTRGDAGGAGIGGGTWGDVGKIIISGGKIEATAQGYGAGIGGGLGKSGGSITIEDAEITATACAGAGIGGGRDGDGGTIIIKSGKVTAKSAFYCIYKYSGTDYYLGGGAGIGGGLGKSGGSITIYGGEISATAEGGKDKYYDVVGGAGIGGGSYGSGGTVNILGGTVTAVGSNYTNALDSAYGAGIGGGNKGSGGSVTISGSGTTVTANGVTGHVMAVGSANSSGGSLAVSGNAALILEEAGTNAETRFTDCTLSGSGAESQGVGGTYVRGVKYRSLTTSLTASPTAAKAGKPVTLTATLTGLEDGALPTGTVTFRCGSTLIKSTTAISGGQATVTWTPDAGTYTLTAEYVQGAGDNYAAAKTAQLTNYTVGQQSSSITALPSADPITVVGKLSSAKLIGGSGNVAGTFTWANPDTVVPVSGSYEVVFTPTNANYSPCTGMVSVTVNKTVADTSADVIFDLSDVTLPSGVTAVSVGSSTLSESGEGSGTYSSVDKLISDSASHGNLKDPVVYDLKLLDQVGNPIENFTGNIKVKIKIPSGMSGDLHVYWYNPGSNTLSDMNAVRENGYLVFETTHFSYYAIVQHDLPITNPKTGDENFPVIIWALFGAGSTFGIMAKNKRLKFKRGK